MTHAGARGSNALIGQNILQTMTWMVPDEYEQLQALNAWTGRSDLVGLRHIDEFTRPLGGISVSVIGETLAKRCW